MPDRSSKKKRPADLNRLAHSIVADATAEDEDVTDPDEAKNAAAVELGRQGGLKGGRARAEKLTPERRSEIARKAAAARWAKLPQSSVRCMAGCAGLANCCYSWVHYPFTSLASDLPSNTRSASHFYRPSARIQAQLCGVLDAASKIMPSLRRAGGSVLTATNYL
jgi:hypothetical protein